MNTLRIDREARRWASTFCASFCGGPGCRADGGGRRWGVTAMLALVLALVGANAPAAIQANRSTVDDYAAPASSPSRIGTDRGAMGGGSYQVSIAGGGPATAVVTSVGGWAGVWTSLMHTNAETADTLQPDRLLGPYVLGAYQSRIVGVEFDLAAGSGTFAFELKDAVGTIVHGHSWQLSGGPQVLTFAVTPTSPLKDLNWLVNGPGSATVIAVRLILASPLLTTREAIFLYSYGHLSQCYDPTTGWVRDKAHLPATTQAAVQSTGMFALVTALAYRLGYIDAVSAKTIVGNITTALTSVPAATQWRGLLPRFLANGAPYPGGEWSSVDTGIALLAAMLASQSLGLSTAALETMVKAIDWADLTDQFTRSASHGYAADQTKLPIRWDAFGGEAMLIAVAFAAANPGQVLRLEAFANAPTYDGSGFNDELGALLLPMAGRDALGNDWGGYRCAASLKQLSYFSDRPLYRDRGLFGLSAGEVPEPGPGTNYGAWGLGGHNGTPNDGTAVVGYPIIAPHYAALVADAVPAYSDALFEFLAAQGFFTPLNNVESLGITAAGLVKWNALKGSWNLALQALGAGRSLRQDYGPYGWAAANAFLNTGYRTVMASDGDPGYCRPYLPSRGGWRSTVP